MKFKNQAKFEEITQALKDGKVIICGDERYKKINGFLCSEDKNGKCPSISYIISLEDCEILEPEAKPVRCKCGNEAELNLGAVATAYHCTVCGIKIYEGMCTNKQAIQKWNEFQETYEPEVKLFDVMRTQQCGDIYILSYINPNKTFTLFYKNGEVLHSIKKKAMKNDILLARCSSLKEATEFMFKDV